VPSPTRHRCNAARTIRPPRAAPRGYSGAIVSSAVPPRCGPMSKLADPCRSAGNQHTMARTPCCMQGGEHVLQTALSVPHPIRARSARSPASTSVLFGVGDPVVERFSARPRRRDVEKEFRIGPRPLPVSIRLEVVDFGDIARGACLC